METGYLNFHDEEHFSDFSLSLGQHNLLDDSQSSLLAIDDDFDYVESRLDTSGGLWGTEQELNGDMAVLPVSGVASVIPKIENMKEDFAKVLTDWQEHIGYLQASDMGEDIDMAELSMAMPEKLNTDLPEDIFQSEIAEAQLAAHSSPIKKRQRDSNVARSPKTKKISESSSQDIDAARGKSSFDLASFITGDDDDEEETHRPESPTNPADDSFELRRVMKEEMQQVEEEPKKIRSAVKTMKPAAVKVLKPPMKTEPFDSSSDNEDAIDVETVTEQMPVLEAGDVKSLLEQFEASEASAIARPAVRKAEAPEAEKPTARAARPSAKVRAIDQSKQTLLKKSVETQDSKFHKNIRDSLPKEVIDRIKASARKKVISVIPALSTAKVGARNNGTRMQEAAATLSRTKLLKIVANGSNGSTGRVDGSVQLDHDYCSSSSSSSSSGSVASSSESCGTSGVATSSGSGGDSMAEISPLPNKSPGYYVPITSKKPDGGARSGKKKAAAEGRGKTGERWADCGSKKDSGLESGDVSDASEEPASILPSTEQQQQQQNRNTAAKIPAKDSPQPKTISGRSGGAEVAAIAGAAGKTLPKVAEPVYEMKIRSALATSILQLRKGVITKTKSLENGHKVKQMVSVLKKPPNAAQSSVLPNKPNESIVTTKNSSNDEVQNIIVQEATTTTTTATTTTTSATQGIDESTVPKSLSDEAKKPPRRKLNLAEYRSRREQTRSDNSRTCSPVQPMTLVYVHHASTTTEPIKDDPENPVWSEREIVSVLKPKAEIEEEKNRERPATREIAIQTNETVFDCPARTEEEETEITEVVQTTTETRVTRMRDRKNRRYRQRRSSSSSSRSRSRSRSGSRSRSRSRSRSKSRSRSRSRGVTRSRSRNRSRSRSSRSLSSRSRSRRCSGSNTRRRRISHRRSSVSSSSSWSSRSRSHTRSTSRSRSRSRSLRSRSRSSRSRSRSRSSFRYSSCSRSSSRSNLERSKWSGGGRRRRRGRRDRRTSYDRYRRGSSGSSHGYRGWRRSSQSSYSRRQYDSWYHKEKKRQMEERRVIYVGRLDENTTKVDLRRRFEAFGPVLDISVHFREHGDNYGFVTFAYKNDAYEAVEHGNDDPSLPQYDLSFGGRRAFCKVKYADLDGMASNSLSSGVSSARSSLIKTDEDNTFDLLLKEAKAKLRKRMV